MTSTSEQSTDLPPTSAEPQSTVVKSQEGRLEAITPFEAVGLVAGVVGITAVVFGLVLYAIDPGIYRLATGNAVFGAVAIVFYAATNRRTFQRGLAGRSTTFVALEIFVVAGLIAVMAVINYFAAQNHKEWDLTRDGLYTLQEQSVKVASSLEQDVDIIGFFRPSEAARGTVTQAINLYRQYTSRIKLRFINPDNPPPDLLTKYDMNSQSPRIVVAASASDQFAKLRVPTEEGITNALIKVAQSDARKVYFVTGHGEPAIDDHRSEESLAAAASALRNEGFTVEALTLLDKANVPSDASLVIIAGARSALLPNEVEALKAYLDRGGRALIMLEPGYEYGLDRVFRPYGVEVGDNVLIDPNPVTKARGFGPDTTVITKFEAHPITNKLQRSAVLFPRTRSV
ncbi:MAG: GldG family protein, partial [Myxococcota bacterium]